MKNHLRIAILGAGNGAHAMAGHLALRGFPVRLYNKFEEELTHLREQEGIALQGAIEGFGPLETITTRIEEAIADAEVIMVVVPAHVHRFMAELCAPHLHAGQVIVLNPGRTGGALEFSNVLRGKGVPDSVVVAEAQSLVYACRISGPARVEIKGIKKRVPVAAFPATDTPRLMEAVSQLYPEFVPAANVLETSLDNIGAVFHPSTVILNTNRIEAGDDFDFYQGMTPTVTHFLEAIDAERLAVARAFGIDMESAAEWLLKTYEGVHGQNLYECIQSNAAYEGLKAPKTLNVRYITEDVPTGLVPFASLGALAGVPTPTSWAMVDVACALFDRDFWREGRSAENLGLAGMSVDEIVALVEGR